jgi:hypothetical protein
VGLHEEIGKGGPARLAVEVLLILVGIKPKPEFGLTPYASALVPGGNASKPHACCTSFG